MKIAYFNCSKGASGDMLLASLLDAGITAAALERKLKKAFGLGGWSLQVKSIKGAWHVPIRTLTVRGDIKFGSPAEMKGIIVKSGLSRKVIGNTVDALDTLIKAEAKVHRLPQDSVHFHELNSIDTMVDIAGFFELLEIHSVEKVYSSPLNIGKPAPATVEIVKNHNMVVFSNNNEYEYATPTGAAILSVCANVTSDMPYIKIEKSGCGAGTKVQGGERSTVNLMIGETSGSENREKFLTDSVVLLETNIDDMDPRVYPYVFDMLLEKGAKDVWMTQVIMKKGRPGIVLSALCTSENEAELSRIIFNETTTLGIRRQLLPRYILQRISRSGLKAGVLSDSKIKIKSEFETSKKLAKKTRQPLHKTIL